MPVDPTDPRLEDLTSAALTDAMGRHFDHRAHLPGLVSPTPEQTVFGPAATVRFVPAREDLADEGLSWPRAFHEAIGDAPAEKLLVLGSSRRPGVTLAGGTKLSRLDRWSLAGALVDGRVRDFDELGQLDAGVWCRGEGLRWGGDRRLAIDVDAPVAVGEVTIAPGDVVYQDRAGGVVIPEGSVDEVLDEAVQIEREDQDYKEQVQGENREAILAGTEPGAQEG